MLRHYQPPNLSIMGADQLRTTLIEQIQTGDESFLRIVHAVAEAYRLEHAQQEKEEAIVGYSTNGEAVTASMFLKQADEAMEAVNRGEYTTIEELEKESATWLERTR
jgi:hypothetical protein